MGKGHVYRHLTHDSQKFKEPNLPHNCGFQTPQITRQRTYLEPFVLCWYIPKTHHLFENFQKPETRGSNIPSNDPCPIGQLETRSTSHITFITLFSGRVLGFATTPLYKLCKTAGPKPVC